MYAFMVILIIKKVQLHFLLTERVKLPHPINEGGVLALDDSL